MISSKKEKEKQQQLFLILFSRIDFVFFLSIFNLKEKPIIKINISDLSDVCNTSYFFLVQKKEDLRLNMKKNEMVCVDAVLQTISVTLLDNV